MTRRTKLHPIPRSPGSVVDSMPDLAVPPVAKPTVVVAEDRAPDDAVEIVASSHPEAHGFLLRARATGRMYQVTARRDPRQPRFWCVVVYRCSPGGLADSTEQPWVGPGGLSREDLPAVMEAIRADVGAWLDEAPCRDLRRWLLAPLVPSPAPIN